MTYDPPTINLILLAGAGFLYMVLGSWVLSLTPRRRQTTLLGAFAIAFGLRDASVFTLIVFDQIAFFGLAYWSLWAVFGTLAGLLALALAWSTPDPLEDRRLLGVALAIGFAFSTAMATADFLRLPYETATLWAEVAFVVGLGFLHAAAVLWTLRARPSRGASPGNITQFALLTLAIGMLAAFFGGLTVPATARAMATGATAEMVRWSTGTLAWLIIAGLWGRNMLRAGEDTVRIHRTVMLGLLGLLAAGALWGTFSTGPLGGNISWGVMRTLGVGLVAYGVLRHDLAGLDAKAEWTISKTTVAGVFVAVFFIVSEGAQVLFADFAQNELLGVIAAGALLFALSPIQRLADRIAGEVVPGGDAEAASDARARYRKAVELALADGEISSAERRHLAERAEELDLSPTEIVEIQKQVEDEASGGDAP